LTSEALRFIMGHYVSRCLMRHVLRRLWNDEEGQDVAEYAVMLAVILLLVVGTIKLVGTNANSTFSSVASSTQ
jgi:Flp pilus assembly pilin Flp